MGDYIVKIIKKVKELFQMKYLLILPALIYFVFTLIYFTQWVLNNALRDVSLGTIEDPPFVGLSNFIRILNDSVVIRSIINTVFYYVLITVTLQILIGLAFALLVNRELNERLRDLAMTVLFLPCLMAPVGIGLIWRYILNTELGFLNQILRTLGANPQYLLSHGSSAIWTAVAINVWQFAPFVFIILLAGLRSLPDTPYEAAKIDGASSWQRLWYITLPLLKPVILVALAFRVTDGFRLFAVIWGLTGGGPGTSTYTITLAIYREAFFKYNLGYASAISILLVVLITIFSGSILRILYSGGDH